MRPEMSAYYKALGPHIAPLQTQSDEIRAGMPNDSTIHKQR